MDDPDKNESFESADAGDAAAGAPRAPRPAGEGVRIIGADEAAAALEGGPPHRPPGARYGDVPAAPQGPRPSISFPLAESEDPAAVVPRPPVVDPPPPRRPSSDQQGERAGRDLYQPPGRPDSRGPGHGGRDSGGSATEEHRYADSGRPASALHRGPAVSPADFPASDPSGALHESSPTESGRPAAPRSQAPRPPTASGGPASGPTALPHWSEPATGEVPRILPGEPNEDDLGAWSAIGSGPRWRDQATDWESPDFDASGLLDDDAPGAAEFPVEVRDDDSDLGSLLLGEREAPEPRPASRRAPDVTSTNVADTSARTFYEEPSGGLHEGQGRDVGLAALTGAVIAVVILLAAKVGPAPLLVVSGAFVVMAAAELFGALQQRGFHPATLLGLVATASLLGATYWKGEQAMPLVLALFVVFTLLWYLFGVVRARAAASAAATLLAFTYVGFLGSYTGLLLAFPGRRGVAYLIGAMLATAAYDVGAFFVGSRLGRSPLAGSVSPNKTWEGALGASTLTLVVCLLIVRGIHPWNGGRAFALALVVIVAAPLGDLCESMIKRDLGVKDIGWILPGHGGILDRIDALLFVVPATYYLVRLLKIA